MAKRGMGRILKGGGLARDIVPPVVGGLLTAGTTLGVRMWVTPTSPMSARIYQWAPGIAALVGAVLGGLSMYFLGDKRTAMSAATVAVIVGGTQLAAERLLASDLRAGALPTGTGAVVPQYGTGAIVWERLRGLGANDQGQGANIALRGVIDGSAFGTQPFMG